MKLSEILTTVASQSGVNTEEAAFKSIVEKVNTFELDDDTATKITAPRFTLDAAKQNPDLKRHFTALALNGGDAEFDNVISELGMPDEITSDLKKETKTFKKFVNLVKKVKELESQKASEAGGSKDKLNKQIEDLNKQLSDARENWNKEKSSLLESHKSERVNWTLDNIYSGFNYALPVTKEASVLTAKSLVTTELQKKGLKFVHDTSGIKLETNEGTEYYDNANKKVSPSEFIQKVLHENKILKVTESTQATNGTKVPTNGVSGKGMGVYSNLVKEAMGDLNPQL